MRLAKLLRIFAAILHNYRENVKSAQTLSDIHSSLQVMARERNMEFPLTPMEVLATSLLTPDPPLGPPSICTKGYLFICPTLRAYLGHMPEQQDKLDAQMATSSLQCPLILVLSSLFAYGRF